MDITIVKYAMRNLELIKQDGIEFCQNADDIYILLKTGHNFKLADIEVKHHACEYLRYEIERIIAL